MCFLGCGTSAATRPTNSAAGHSWYDGPPFVLSTYGLLHIYAGAADGRFLGAEMVGPGGEHPAHLMAWAIQQKLTVFDMLRMPFYHPTVEEGLRTALREAARRVMPRTDTPEIAFSD